MQYTSINPCVEVQYVQDAGFVLLKEGEEAWVVYASICYQERHRDYWKDMFCRHSTVLQEDMERSQNMGATGEFATLAIEFIL